MDAQAEKQAAAEVAAAALREKEQAAAALQQEGQQQQQAAPAVVKKRAGRAVVKKQAKAGTITLQKQKPASTKSKVKIITLTGGKRSREVEHDDPDDDGDDDGDGDSDDSDDEYIATDDEDKVKSSPKGASIQVLKTRLHCARREQTKWSARVEAAVKMRTEVNSAYDQRAIGKRPYKALDDVSLSELRKYSKLEAVEQGTLLHLFNSYVRAALDIQAGKIFVAKYDKDITKLSNQIHELECGKLDVKQVDW